MNEQDGSFDEQRKFTGHEYDGDTGLNYMVARYYDGNVGRFMSVDPQSGDLTDPQQLNVYAYSRNNPIRYIDPNGRGIGDFMRGLSNSYYTNYAFGFGRIESSDASFNLGQTIGDSVSLLQGLVEMTFGAAVGTGGIVIAAETGVGVLVIPGALAIGSTVGVHGASLAGTASKNILKKDSNESEGSTKPNPNNNAVSNRKINVNKSESKYWKSLDNAKNGWKQSGTGKDTQYYKWDYTHNDIEVYDRGGNHLGSLDPTTGNPYRDAQPSHNINKSDLLKEY